MGVSTRELCTATQDLLSQALAPSTQTSYRRSWSVLNYFRKNVLSENIALPVSVGTIAMFVTYLCVYCSLQVSTIRSHLSAISYVHKLKNIFDPTANFLIRKLVDAVAKRSQSSDTRLPITRTLLHSLGSKIQAVYLDNYTQLLFKAMFYVAWYGCLRVGEFTLTPKSEHCISLADLTFTENAFLLNLKSFKHKKGTSPLISISRSTRFPSHCPYQILKAYLEVRGTHPGPLFCWKNGQPFSRSRFAAVMKVCLSLVNVHYGNYNTHSFRIGRLTEAVTEGSASLDQLMKLGRWSSSAIHQYYRPSTVSVP